MKKEEILAQLKEAQVNISRCGGAVKKATKRKNIQNRKKKK
jgi:hypothetical protein